MDPISTAILAGLAAGVAGGVTDAGKKLIVDAYEALKAALQQKFGVNSELVETVGKLEKKPDRPDYKQTLEYAVKDSGAAEDADLVAKAQALLEQLKQQPGGEQKIQMIAQGSYIAQASHGGTASVNINQSKD